MAKHFTAVGTRETPPEVTRIVADAIEAIPKDADQRVCIEQHDRNGKLVVRSYGPSWQEQQEAHDNGKCDWLCSICYAEAMGL